LIQQLVWGILTSLRSEFNLDPDRFYITGVSMGGFGTWSTISAFPDTFAAAVAMCGYAPSGFDPAFNRLAVWYFHAKDDATVDIAGGRAMIRAMREAGGTPIYTEYDSGGHSIWTPVYATPRYHAHGKWVDRYPCLDWRCAAFSNREHHLPGPRRLAAGADQHYENSDLSDGRRARVFSNRGPVTPAEYS
jgi:pimeloyl-ACP methyl ester carboxylesterase